MNLQLVCSHPPHSMDRVDPLDVAKPRREPAHFLVGTVRAAEHGPRASILSVWEV